MTSPTPQQVATHRENVAKAAGILQAALVPGVSEATKKAAYVAYHKSVIASARTNGHSCGSLNAMHSLGDPAGEYGQAGDT